MAHLLYFALPETTLAETFELTPHERLEPDFPPIDRRDIEPHLLTSSA
jgi:hypothetical protein